MLSSRRMPDIFQPLNFTAVAETKLSDHAILQPQSGIIRNPALLCFRNLVLTFSFRNALKRKIIILSNRISFVALGLKS